MITEYDTALSKAKYEITADEDLANFCHNDLVKVMNPFSSGEEIYEVCHYF